MLYLVPHHDRDIDSDKQYDIAYNIAPTQQFNKQKVNNE